MFKKTPGAAVDKALNNIGKQVAALDTGIAELHLETIDIDAQIEALQKKQAELDDKVGQAVSLRNALARQAGIEAITVEFFLNIQEGGDED